VKATRGLHAAAIAGALCLLVLLAGSAMSAEFRERSFVRGDADGDGQPTIADAIRLLDFLFDRGPAADCLDALDADDNGTLDLADGMHLLSFLFSGGSPPPPPHPACGLDRTGDSLGCAGQERCAREMSPEVRRRALAEIGEAPEDLLTAEPGVKPEVMRGKEDSLDEDSTSLTSRESTALPRLRRGGGGLIGAPIAIGQPVSGEIRSQTQVDAYVFTAASSQWIAAHRLSASTSVLNWKIEDAWGRLLASDMTDLSDLGPVPLLGGDYTLSVLPEGTGTGVYEFRIVDAAPEERPLAIGETVQGTIDPEHPGQRDHYTFAASAGQTVFLDLISTENSNITWEIKDAIGREIVAGRKVGDHGPVGLMGGTYRLTVEGPLATGGNLATGSYSFRIVGLEPPVAEPIALGQVVDRAISLPGEIDAYTLTVPAGQVVFLDQLASSNSAIINWELLDGLGRAVLARTGNLGDVGPLVLLGGTYELRVLSEGGGTATYKFRASDATAIQRTISIGEEVSEEIPADRPGQARIYAFTADPGRIVTVELIATSNGGALNWMVEDAHGRTVLARTTSLTTSAAITLMGGSYRLTVLGEGDASGTFRFRIRDDGLGSFIPMGSLVSVGDEVTGTIPIPGGSMSYAFSATEGRRVYLDLLIGHADLDWEIFDAVGRSMNLKRANSTDTSDLGPYGLAAGTYTIALRARTAAAAPAFSFRISDAAVVAGGAAVGNIVSGTFLGSAGAVHRYSFPVSQGQRVFLDRKISSSRLAWTLLDPVGEEVFPFVRGDNADSDTGPFTLVAGTYTLVLDPEFGYQPAYEVAIRPVEDSVDAAALGVSVQKSFAGQAGATHTYRIELAEAKRLFFDRMTATSRLDWSLIDPVGEAVFGPERADVAESDQGPFTLSAGAYSLVFDPQYSYEPVYDLRIVEAADTTAPLAFGAPRAGVLGPGATATYIFDAIEGQRVFIDIVTTDGFLRWSLFDALGEAVYRDERLLSPDVDLGPLNLAEGTYRLVVDATASSTPAYGFTAWNVAVDLGFEDLQVSPRVFFASDLRRDAAVTWTVTNLGGGPGAAGPSTDRIVLSTDLVLGNADDILVGEFLRFEPLQPHSSRSRTETVDINEKISLGTYKLFVVLDAGDDLLEAGGEDDNTRSLDIQIVEDLPPGEPGFITTETFPIDFEATPESLSVDVPLLRPVDLSGVRFVSADALSILLSRPGGIGAQTRITMSLLSGRTEMVEISDVAPSAGVIGLFTARFSRRLSPQLVALLPTRIVDGLRFSFDQPSTTRAEIGSTHADGRLRVHFASCEFQPCGPHEERVVSGVAGVSLQGAGTTEWRVVNFAEAVPGDGLRFVSGPRFSATIEPNPFNLLNPAAGTSEAQLILDDGSLITLDGWEAPSALGNPPGRMLSADHSLGLDENELAGRRILGFQWRVHIAGASNDASYTPADPFSVRFLYEAEACRGLIDIPPVELSPASGTAFPVGSSVVISGRAVAPQQGRPVSAVLVSGEPVDSFDGAGRFFKTVRIAEGENLFVVQVVEPGCGEYETLLNLRGEKDGASGLSGYSEASAQLKVEYADTTFVRGAEALLDKARVRNVSQHTVRGPILMALANLRPPATELQAAAGLTDRGEPYVVLLDGGSLAPGDAGPYVLLPFSNPDRVRVQFDVRWLSPANRPPFFETAPPARALAGTSFTYDVSASDADGDPVSFKLDFGPAGMAIDAGTGLLRWTPAAGDLGAHDISVSAIDGLGGQATQRWTLVVSGPGTNRPPFFTTLPIVGGSVGGAYAYDADATDPDGDPVGYGLLSGPAGLSIDAVSGEILWSYALPGIHAVSIRAADAGGAEAVQTFNLVVGALPSNPSAPRITTSPSTEAVTGILYVYQPAATDPDGDVLSFVLDPAPAGMTLDAATGRIRWTPALDQVGQHSVGLSVGDGRGGETRQSFTVVVRDAATANLPPVIESTPPGFALVGRLFRYDVDALDPEGETFAFSLGTGPVGASIQAASGVVEWTPKAADVGTHVVGVRATDSRGASGNQVFEVRVRTTNALPQITSENAPGTVLAGKTWQYDLDATDADGDLLRYEIASGPAAMPNAMTVQPVTGLFTWNTTPADVGVHAVVLRVADCCEGEVEMSFSIEVLKDEQPPIVEIGFSAYPAPVGSPVEVRLTAADNAGIASRALTVECAPLAARDLRLDEIGRVTFSSSAVGYCTFTATARDPSGNETQVSRTLQVGNPDDPLDPHRPVVEIHSPLPGSTVTAPTTLIATISDATEDGKPGSGPVTWTVELAAQGSTEYKTIASGSGEKTAAAITTFDPTLLPNGTYRMRIIGSDTVQTGGIEFDLHVAGELKLGNLALRFTDLIVPLAGLPIEVRRIYDTLDTSSGDFGPGWRLALPGEVQDSAIESKTGNGIVDLLATEPFQPGTRVFVTRSNGQRVGFTFQPQNLGGFLSFLFAPVFIPDPGVRDRLEVVEPAGNFFVFGGKANQVGVPYNPRVYRFTTREGIESTIGEEDGLLSVRNPSGVAIDVKPDGLVSSTGASLAIERDGEGRITRIIAPDDDPADGDAPGEYRYLYDAAGRLSAFIDPAGAKIEYFYEDPRFPNHLTRIEDPLGRTALTAVFDAGGRLAAQCGPGADPGDAGGCVQFETDSSLARSTSFDAQGNRLDSFFDERGNLIEERRWIDATTVLTRSFTYDAAGNLLTATDPDGRTTTTTYDSEGNRLTHTDPEGRTRSFTYGACDLPETSCDPAGNCTTYTYDDRCRLTTVRDPLGGLTEHRYDAQGNRIESIDSVGNRRRYSYDAWGRLNGFTDPAGNSASFDIGPSGELRAAVDRNGRRVEYSHDSAHRITRELWDDGREILYTFDAAGRLLSARDPDSVLSFEYREDGTLASLDNEGTPGVPRVKLSYAFDGAGRPIEVADSLGGVTQRFYDAASRLVSIRQSGAGVDEKRVDVEYFGSDALAAVRRYADLAGAQPVASTFFDYDCSSCPLRLAGLRHLRGSDGSAIDSVNLVRDVIGNVTAMTDAEGFHSYAYDGLHRLLSAVHPAGGPQPAESYAYDGAGNRTRSHLAGANTLAYATGAAGDKLVEDENSRYEYDRDGNLTVRTEKATGSVSRFSYDLRNRLTRVVVQNATGTTIHEASYTYDVANRRIRAVRDGVVQTWVHDGPNPILTWTGGALTRRLYDGSMDGLLAEEKEGSTRWFLTDHTRTVRDVVDNSGAVLAHYAYDTFGRLLVATGPSAGDEMLFTAREFEKTMGMGYFRARYYFPELGRFNREDPRMPYRYGYGENNPLVFTDPTGEGPALEYVVVIVGILTALDAIFCAPIEPFLDCLVTTPCFLNDVLIPLIIKPWLGVVQAMDAAQGYIPRSTLSPYLPTEPVFKLCDRPIFGNGF